MQTLKLTSDTCFTVEDDEVRAGWERWYLLTSDIHLDNPHCRRDLLRRDLEEAHIKKAKVFSFGDLFCAMGGKYDPRRAKSGVLPENNNDYYLDSLVKNNAAFLRPWADDIALLSEGNHETAIASHNETNLTQRLAEEIGCAALGYAGLVRFLFMDSKGGNRTQIRLFFHHGAGGGGEVNKGVQRTNRQAVWLPDADIVVGGHVHESWVLNTMRQCFTTSGRPYLQKQMHVQLATYKDEFDLRGGFHMQKGRPPKPLGGAWLQFFYDSTRPGNVNFRAYSTY